VTEKDKRDIIPEYWGKVFNDITQQVRHIGGQGIPNAILSAWKLNPYYLDFGSKATE
jgi:hypothetical protein